MCIPPATDLYWGLKLVDSTGAYYGWVRVYVTQNYITIKDYAYNSASDQYIIAGDTMTGMQDKNMAEQSVSIDGSNNAITITTGNKEYQNSLVEITDSAGKQVCKDKVSSGYYKTENLSKGTYLVRIYSDKEVITKKIIVN